MPGKSSNCRKSAGSIRETSASLNRTQPFGLPIKRAPARRAALGPVATSNQPFIVACGVHLVARPD